MPTHPIRTLAEAGAVWYICSMSITLALIALSFAAIWGFLTVLFSNFLAYAEIRHKKKRSHFRVDVRPITYTITLLEILGFSIVSSFYLQDGGFSQMNVTKLVATIGGWFAIKTIGQRVYANNEGHAGLSQTEMRNRYIIETVANIAGGIALGAFLAPYLA